MNPDLCSHATVDLTNDVTNLEFTSDLPHSEPEIQQATSSINVEPGSNISGQRRPQLQTGTTEKRLLSFSIVRNIFQRFSVSYSHLSNLPLIVRNIYWARCSEMSEAPDFIIFDLNRHIF